MFFEDECEDVKDAECNNKRDDEFCKGEKKAGFLGGVHSRCFLMAFIFNDCFEKTF